MALDRNVPTITQSVQTALCYRFVVCCCESAVWLSREFYAFSLFQEHIAVRKALFVLVLQVLHKFTRRQTIELTDHHS